MKGSYALLISLDGDEDIQVGSLGVIRFSRGFYLYIGSAMNGIEGRVSRHLRKDKKIHWHIDYLLQKAEILEIYYLEGKKRWECSLARACEERFLVVPRFGSSGCGCGGHLFYGKRKELIDCIRTYGLKTFRR